MIDVAGSVTIARRVGEVFAFVSDPAREPLWHTAARDVTQLPGGLVGVGTHFRVRYEPTTGLPEAMRVISRFDRDRLIVAESALGQMKSTVACSFDEAAGGIRLTRRVELGSDHAACNASVGETRAAWRAG